MKCKTNINSQWFIHLAFILAVASYNTSCNQERGSFKTAGSVEREPLVRSDRQIYYGMLINYYIPINEVLDSVNIENSGLHLMIDKSDRILSILAGQIVIKQYPVVLGHNPLDDKLRQGDYCTPEGSFKIIDKYNHENWKKFIWIDYPNEESLRKISEAKRAGLIPMDSSPGGEIGIHGVPESSDFVIDEGRNWTLGCISLKNKDVIEIFENVHVGTEVVIRK